MCILKFFVQECFFATWGSQRKYLRNFIGEYFEIFLLHQHRIVLIWLNIQCRIVESHKMHKLHIINAENRDAWRHFIASWYLDIELRKCWRVNLFKKFFILWSFLPKSCYLTLWNGNRMEEEGIKRLKINEFLLHSTVTLLWRDKNENGRNLLMHYNYYTLNKL